jgi:hypothetical protein
MSELIAASTATSLRKEDLHASLSDPVLDTMNFLNEITFRYPKAISFAPGRPYDGFFDTEHAAGLAAGGGGAAVGGESCDGAAVGAGRAARW